MAGSANPHQRRPGGARHRRSHPGDEHPRHHQKHGKDNGESFASNPLVAFSSSHDAPHPLRGPLPVAGLAAGATERGQEEARRGSAPDWGFGASTLPSYRSRLRKSSKLATGMGTPTLGGHASPAASAGGINGTLPRARNAPTPAVELTGSAEATIPAKAACTSSLEEVATCSSYGLTPPRSSWGPCG